MEASAWIHGVALPDLRLVLRCVLPSSAPGLDVFALCMCGSVFVLSLISYLSLQLHACH